MWESSAFDRGTRQCIYAGEQGVCDGGVGKLFLRANAVRFVKEDLRLDVSSPRLEVLSTRLEVLSVWRDPSSPHLEALSMRREALSTQNRIN